jgi:ubiquinone/menaquinone biosynthesis C-methylase UbiE
MPHYLNANFDWTNPEVVSAFDEVSLWSFYAGMMLLEHLPTTHPTRVLDVGCGTGFPILELAERFGSNSRVVGIDVSETALTRASQKALVRGIKNIEFIRAGAAALPFAHAEFDVVVSNLGINNFADRSTAFRECCRVAKPGAILAITTNLFGHMQEFYALFRQTLSDLNLNSLIPRLEAHIAHRAKLEDIQSLLIQFGFVPCQPIRIDVPFRYSGGSVFLRHSFIRAAFLPAWIEITKDHNTKAIFARLEENLNAYAESTGELRVTVPFAYLEATKPL